MPPIIQPLYGLPSTGAGAEAEQKMLDFLKALPEDYYVLRELRTYPSLQKRLTGSREDRIDFVVIGPALGIMILEVKDWNIRRNRFIWPDYDQYSLRKIDEYGQEIHIRNPYEQVTEYRHAIIEILRSELGARIVPVQGFVAFPKLARAEFENTFTRDENAQRKHLQERYLLDWEHTLFGDMLEHYWDNPLELLKQFTPSNRTLPYSENEIVQAVNVLIPPKLRVGDLSAHDRGYARLLLMDEKQQKWAFSDEVRDTNYMLDVAGSGKTNILLSRAMHLANQSNGVANFQVLVLTYNKALARELRRLLDLKIKNQHLPDALHYEQTIQILHIEDLMEHIVAAHMGEPDAERWRVRIKSELSDPNEYLEYRLPEKCQDILYAQGERFRIYDYLLVDEVQDFSDFFLDVALCLLKRREKVFMVGDAGQKLFDRTHNLTDLDLTEERTRIPASYQMYRNPKFIAQLAWSFLRKDSHIVYELQQQGYAENIKSKNAMLTQPVFKRCMAREELLTAICDHIADGATNRIRYEQVLCIALPGTLQALDAMFRIRHIPACWANEISADEHRVVLAEFTTSKGLERDYVYILDTDCLSDGSLSHTSPFQTSDILEQEARKSRIKLFVALTRAIREVYLYYTHAHNRFIRELLDLQAGGERI